MDAEGARLFWQGSSHESRDVACVFESSIWLGNDLKNYTAHYFGLTLAYSFK